MSASKHELFKFLLKNFLDLNEDVEAIIVSDDEGLIIAGEKRSSVDMEIISVLTAITNPILKRIQDEFAFKKFGTASFDTDNYRLLFISVNVDATLSIVLNNMASVDKMSPYAYFLAEKTAQIITSKEGDVIQLDIPNFEYEATTSDRLKDQIYQMHLDSGGMYRFKFIIIGEHEVGKTSLVKRFVEKKFSKDYRATLGLNILSHSFKFVGNEISVSLWDIGAQAYFKRFRKTYYIGAQAAFIVFDLTNRESYEQTTKWFEELNEFIGSPDLPIVIVGNKSDLERKVEYQEGVTLASELSSRGVTNISYIETSALTGANVEDAFSLISYHYITKRKIREEVGLKQDLLTEINEIIATKDSLKLSFFSESQYWNPGLQILTEIEELGNFEQALSDQKEKIYNYSNGIVLKDALYDVVNVSDSDGVFCIFDARSKEHINPKWKEIVIKIIENIQENKVALIGIRISDNSIWSQLMEEFDVNEHLEKKMVSLMFFKIGLEYRLEIYDQLKVMLNTIKNFG